MTIKMMPPEEIYSLFKNTLEYLDAEKLELSDNELQVYIFEDLEGDAFSYFHSFTVDKLVDSQIIPAKVKPSVMALRNKISELVISKNTVDAYRNDKEWKNAREEAAYILSEINKHQKNK